MLTALASLRNMVQEQQPTFKVAKMLFQTRSLLLSPGGEAVLSKEQKQKLKARGISEQWMKF